MNTLVQVLYDLVIGGRKPNIAVLMNIFAGVTTDFSFDDVPAAVQAMANERGVKLSRIQLITVVSVTGALRTLDAAIGDDKF